MVLAVLPMWNGSSFDSIIGIGIGSLFRLVHSWWSSLPRLFLVSGFTVVAVGWAAVVASVVSCLCWQTDMSSAESTLLLTVALAMIASVAV